MANLSTQNIGTNFKGMLNLGSTINTPLSTTLQAITDGDGVASPLQLATNRIALGTSTGTGLLNFPDAGTTAADGISFGTSEQIYRYNAGMYINARAYSIRINDAGWLSGTSTGISFTPSTLTGSSATSALSLTQTWNTTGNPTAIFLNVTNTASGASAKVIDLQVGGTTLFNIASNGQVNSRNILPITNATYDFGSSGLRWKGAYFTDEIVCRRLVATATVVGDNVITAKGFTAQTAPLYRGLDASNTLLFEVSSAGAVSSLYQRYGSGSPEGVVTAPIGAYYSRTDGGASTSFYVKESGVSNTGWVAK